MTGIPKLEDAILQLWTIYNRPKDYPNHYVARLTLIGPAGPSHMPRLLISTDLDAIRIQMMQLGLACINRHPDDEPHIVEVWL